MTIHNFKPEQVTMKFNGIELKGAPYGGLVVWKPDDADAVAPRTASHGTGTATCTLVSQTWSLRERRAARAERKRRRWDEARFWIRDDSYWSGWCSVRLNPDHAAGLARRAQHGMLTLRERDHGYPIHLRVYVPPTRREEIRRAAAKRRRTRGW